MNPEHKSNILMRRFQILDRIGIEMRTRTPETMLELRHQLVREYGQQDVDQVFNVIAKRIEFMQQTANETEKEEERRAYREYVQRYRRYGGKRPFLDRTEFWIAYKEHAELAVYESTGLRKLSTPQKRSLRKLTDLLMANLSLWEDLIPEDRPKNLDSLPRPEEIT